MNSKLNETCFIVSSTKCTSTHIKESSWVTIWIWKIKISQHVNSLLSIRDLEIFLRPKQHCIQTQDHYMRHLEVESGLGPKIKFVALHLKFNFYLRSNFITCFHTIIWPWSKQHHDKPEIRVLDRLRHFLDIGSTWTLHDFCSHSPDEAILEIFQTLWNFSTDQDGCMLM